jgi:two-component system OmpR family response regulator
MGRRLCSNFSGLLNFVSGLLQPRSALALRGAQIYLSGAPGLPKAAFLRGHVKSDPHILIVDDDGETLSLLTDFLQRRGLRVSVAADGEAMRAAMRRTTVDLVVLDVMLPDADGFHLCRDLRAQSSVPIIMLTAVNETTDRVVGLEIGADDFVPKPFDPRELLARIRAVLRRHDPERARHQSPQSYRFAGWTLDCARRRLLAPGDVRVELTSAEFNLLQAFVRSAQRVLTRDQLIELSGGETGYSYDRSVDILISRLRRKMEDDPRAPKMIRTVRGGGYQFVPETTPA